MHKLPLNMDVLFVTFIEGKGQNFISSANINYLAYSINFGKLVLTL